MPGEIVTLLGPNGAGKSTSLRTISGLLRPRKGSVSFEGARLDGMAAHDVVKRGVAQSPEGRRIFPRMTVDENLDLGAFLRKDSGGEQQMLAVARALMARPRLLLLDEPSMGLAPVLVDLIFDTIRRIREQGTTVLLVEQNALAALGVADRAYVLESGLLKLTGNRDRPRLPRRLTARPPMHERAPFMRWTTIKVPFHASRRQPVAHYARAREVGRAVPRTDGHPAQPLPSAA
jgi:branched-chain amino acid transport system ATP-binding protein